MTIPENPLYSMYDTLAFSSRDWSLNKADAWLYGIVIGWTNEALDELCEKHNWSPAVRERLTLLHDNYGKLYQGTLK